MRDLIFAMKWIVSYIRQCFCKHDFEFISQMQVFEDQNATKIPCEIRMVYRCKKCGHTQKIKM